MTLPELYLAYIAHTGEELRDALLRVANEPRSNPNRRKVHDMLAEHLGGVAAVTAGAEGRFGEKIFHVHFFRQDDADVAPKPTPGLHASSPRPREGDPRASESTSFRDGPTEKISGPRAQKAARALRARRRRQAATLPLALAAAAATPGGRRAA